MQQIRVFSLYGKFPDKIHLPLLHQNGNKLKKPTCLGKKIQELSVNISAFMKHFHK